MLDTVKHALACHWWNLELDQAGPGRDSVRVRDHSHDFDKVARKFDVRIARPNWSRSFARCLCERRVGRMAASKAEQVVHMECLLHVAHNVPDVVQIIDFGGHCFLE